MCIKYYAAGLLLNELARFLLQVLHIIWLYNKTIDVFLMQEDVVIFTKSRKLEGLAFEG